MSVQPEQVYAPHPKPVRAQGFFLAATDKLHRFAYPIDNLVYQRGITDIHDTRIYIEHSNKVAFCSFSPSGQLIASADELGKLRVWASNNAENTLSMPEVQPITGPIVDMAWTEDNQRLALVGKGAKTYGCAINAQTGASLGDVMGHSAAVNSVALKPNRPFRMVTVGDDNTVVFYKGPPFRFDHTNREHTKFILCVRYAPDGSVFATSALDSTVIIYDGATGEIVNKFTQECSVCCLAFSPDSKQLLLAKINGHSTVINVADGTVVQDYLIGNQVYQQQAGAVWNKDCKLTVSLNGDFNFLNDDGTFRIERGHTTGITACCSIPGGFVTGDTSGKVLFWHAPEAPYAVYNSEAEGAPIAAIGLQGESVLVTRADGSLHVLSIADGSEIKSCSIAAKSTGSIVSAGDLAVTFCEKQLIFIRGGSAKPVELPFEATSIAIRKDGSEIAVGGKDMKVHFFDAEGKELAVATGNQKDVVAVAYSPDGSKIAASSANREIIVWAREDLANPLQEGWKFHTLPITKIMWKNEDCIVTVAKDRSIRVWSLAKRRKTIESARAHEQAITDALWLDDDTLLTVGLDGCAKTFKITPIA